MNEYGRMDELVDGTHKMAATEQKMKPVRMKVQEAYAEEADISAAGELESTDMASLVAPIQHAVRQVVLVVPANHRQQQQCCLLILSVAAVKRSQ